MVLSLLSRHFTKAESQNSIEGQLVGSIEKHYVGAYSHPRFDRFRRAVDDTVVFPKEEGEQQIKIENAQPEIKSKTETQTEIPKLADQGEANQNGTNPDLESRFFLGGGGGLLGGLARGVASGLLNQGGGFGGNGFNQGGYYPGQGGFYPGQGGFYPGQGGFYPGQGGFYPGQGGFGGNGFGR